MNVIKILAVNTELFLLAVIQFLTVILSLRQLKYVMYAV